MPDPVSVSSESSVYVETDPDMPDLVSDSSESIETVLETAIVERNNEVTEFASSRFLTCVDSSIALKYLNKYIHKHQE